MSREELEEEKRLQLLIQSNNHHQQQELDLSLFRNVEIDLSENSYKSKFIDLSFLKMTNGKKYCKEGLLL